MLVAFVVAAVAGGACKGQALDPRGRFVEDGVTTDAPADWAGESLEIENAGVTPGGGLVVTASTDQKRVHAVARLLALADSDDKRNADLAISDVTSAYAAIPQPGTAPVMLVHCGHGNTHGSAAGQDSGCDALDVSLPAGAVATPPAGARPLSVTARSGTGSVVIDVGSAVLGALEVHGSQGHLEITAPTTLASTITIVAETGDDVLLRLPADFAADAIVLDAPGGVDTSAFPDLVPGKGRGEPGRGAKLISARSVRTGASAGRIVLVRQ